MAWTPNDTISGGISAARGRGENGLNLPFSRECVRTMVDHLGLEPNLDTFVDLRNAIATSLGYEEWNPRNKPWKTINERITDESHVQFLIEHVEDMCGRSGIDPHRQDRSALSTWI